MDQNLYQKINEETDIVALASEYVELSKRGKNYMGLCPFHDEKTPSFSVSPEKNIAVCFGCGKGGSPITFLSQIKNISPLDAAKELAKKLGLMVEVKDTVKDPFETLYQMMEDASLFYRFVLKNSLLGEEAIKYLHQRNLSDDEIAHFEIGLAPNDTDALYKMLKSKQYTVTDMMKLGLVKQNEEGIYYDVFRNRITFPIKNDQGRVVGFSARTLSSKEQVKYMNSTETQVFKKGELLYHFSDALKPAVKEKQVILHEGFFDVIASYQAGYQSTVATMGTALTKEQARLIKRISPKVVIAYDGDNAGIQATLKAIPILKQQGLSISVLNLPSKLDPDDFVKRFGVKAYQDLMNQTMDPYLFGYKAYQIGKDLKRSDDITHFKNEMKELLLGTDPTIIELYERKAFDELGIQLLIHQKEFTLPLKEKPISKKMYHRAIRSIDILLINLLKRTTYLDQIKSKLIFTDIENKEQKNLYKDIMKYYDTNQGKMLDIETFKLAYTKEHDILNRLMDSTEYKKDLLITNDLEFAEIMKPFESYQLQLEINSIIRKLDQLMDEKTKEKHLKTIDSLRKQVKSYDR